jgi:hypothetical protein
MRLALDMAKITKEGFFLTAIGETKHLIKKHCAEVPDEKKRGIESLGHKKVKTAIERHTAMLRQNHTFKYLPCYIGPTKNPHTSGRCNSTGAPPPKRRRQPTAEPAPPTIAGNNCRRQRSQIVNLPAGYLYFYTALTCAEYFNVPASAQDNQHDKDFDPDTLTDEEISTG